MNASSTGGRNVLLNPQGLSFNVTSTPKRPLLAAFYFPNWHNNSHSPGGEWGTLKNAVPYFSGHKQPKVPLWGEEPENNPDVMAKKIKTAADYGVDAFLFCWYYKKKTQDNNPYILESALNDGFLKAPNNNKLKFALMWANHVNEHGFELVDEATFKEKIVPKFLKYMQHPSYLKIDGKPYFSLYEIHNFINGMGVLHKHKTHFNTLEKK